MSTMFPNGLLLSHLLHTQSPADLARGRVQPAAAVAARFGDNIFAGIDYTTMVDDPHKVARAMGLQPADGLAAGLLVVLVCAVLVALYYQRQQAANERVHNSSSTAGTAAQ